jgi:hypothetical protein
MSTPQHSTKFTASPKALSLYFDRVSAPVSRVLAITLSSQRRRDRLDRAEGVAPKRRPPHANP